MAERVVNFDDPADKAKVLGYVRTLAGKWRVEITRYRHRRSDAQNKYLWGCVYKFVAAGIEEAWGESLTDEEVHIMLKNMFLAKPIVNRKTGEVIGQTFPSSAVLDTAQFGKYIDGITKFAAESLGVEIPAAGEILK